MGPGFRQDDECVAAVATSTRSFALSRHHLSEACSSFRPLEIPRAQGRSGAHCTRGLVRMCTKESAHTSIQMQRRHPAFPARWLYGLYVLALVRTAFVSPS